MRIRLIVNLMLLACLFSNCKTKSPEPNSLDLETRLNQEERLQNSLPENNKGKDTNEIITTPSVSQPSDCEQYFQQLNSYSFAMKDGISLNGDGTGTVVFYQDIRKLKLENLYTAVGYQFTLLYAIAYGKENKLPVYSESKNGLDKLTRTIQDFLKCKYNISIEIEHSNSY